MTTRRGTSVLLALSLTVLSCNTTPPPNGDDPNTPGDNVDNFSPPEPPALFEADVPAFVVLVTADRTTGIPGTPFKLDAMIDPAAAGSFAWTIDDGDPVSTEKSPELTFDDPGDYLVDVTVDNNQGAMVTDGILLKVFDPADTATSTAQISPATGMPFTFVQINAPSLDDPEAFIQVMVGDGDPFEPYRPELGTANLLIPADAADSLTDTTAIQIKLLADGEQQESFDFDLSPTPPLADPAGSVARNWLQAGPDLLVGAEDNLVEFLTGIDSELVAEEQALLQAYLRFAQARIGQVRDALLPLIDDLDDSSRTILDQALVANGINLAQLNDLSSQSKAFRSAKNTNDILIDQLCEFHDVVDAIKALADGLGKAGEGLTILGFATAGSPFGPTILGISKIISELSHASKILTTLATLVPRVEDELKVTADPSILKLASDKAVIKVKAQLTKSDICNQANLAETLAGYLADNFFSNLADELVKIIPSKRLAHAAYVHTYRNFGRIDRGALANATSELSTFLKEAMSDLLKANLSTPIVDMLVKPIVEKLCKLRDRDTIELQPEEMILTQSPSNAGRFLNLQEKTIDFYCNADTQGKVTIKAERECGFPRVSGKTRMLTGEVTITCGLESCTEDAYLVADIHINIAGGFHEIPNTVCLNVKETLERQDAMITVTNLDKERTIKIAAVKYRESDQQALDRGCKGDNLLPNETLEECVDRAVAGCDHPLSGPTVGFSAFLGPEETSLPVSFICEQEFIYIDPAGEGTCADALLETVTENWVIQAVYCDNDENAQKNFCPAVDPNMKQFALPGNAGAWIPKETEGCMAMQFSPTP